MLKNWIAEVKDDLSLIASDAKQLRKFGQTVGAILFVLGAFLYWKNANSTSITLVVIGAILMILGTVRPQLLSQLNKIWMAVAIILGSVVSRLILTIVYLALFIPIGVFVRIIGKDLLSIQKRDKDSYWITKDKHSSPTNLY